MLELTGWGDVLRGIGILYWLLAIFLFRQSVKKSSTRLGKIGRGIAVALLFGFFPLKSCVDEVLYVRDHKARLAKAEAIFNERCKTAGEKIYRTVEGVEGIMLLKLRPTDYSPYKQDAIDPYGEDFDWKEPDAYVGTFLQGRDEKGFLVDRVLAEKPGYRYVEAIDPTDGKRYRYTAYVAVRPELVGKTNSESFLLKREPAPGSAPRYGVTYDDITTPEERAQWIAGSSLKVIDTESNEVIAERIGYMIDKALGNEGGARQPWTYAQRRPGWSCPQYRQIGQTRNFVEKSLKIKGQ
jgi:hypothetical protein